MKRVERKDGLFEHCLRPIWIVLYYCFLVLFASLALVVNLIALITALLPDAPWKARFFQAVIRGMVWFCLCLFRVTGIMRVECEGFEALEKRPGESKPVLIANHPCLMDVFLFYIHLPRLTCIYKSSLKKTLIQAEMGKEIGFISNANPRKMVEEGAAKVKAGRQLLIFPEATRTETGYINDFKLGAAAIARMGGVSLQTVLIFTDSNVLSKEQSYFAVPQLPIRMRLEVGQRFDPESYEKSQQLNRALEDYFNEALRHGPRVFHGQNVEASSK